MNRAAGSSTLVSPRFAETVRCALAVAEQTGGLVDPTVGASLVALGYGRDFGDLGDDPAPPAPVGPAPGWRRIELTGRLLRIPHGCMLDLNGVVKSATVDEAAALLPGSGFVSAGGDLAVRGGADVALPGGGAVRVVRGGIATTGTERRRWRRGGAWYHHLIDPATGLPARSPWREVSASGASCLDADVAARAALLAGAAGPELARPARRGGPLRRRGRARDHEPHLDGDGGRAGMHLTSSPVDWYAARAAGIVAYLMLTAVVTLGIAMAGRAPGRRWQRWPMFAVEDVHRVGGLLVGSFIALHVVTIAIDSFLPFSLGQLAIPLTAGYRPIWTALGIVAAELLLALAVTNHYRRRIPRRLWRTRPLRQLRGLDGGHAARHRQRHRPQHPVDDRALRRLRGRGGGGGHLAGGRPPRARGRAATGRRARCGRGCGGRGGGAGARAPAHPCPALERAPASRMP